MLLHLNLAAAFRADDELLVHKFNRLDIGGSCKLQHGSDQVTGVSVAAHHLACGVVGGVFTELDIKPYGKDISFVLVLPAQYPRVY